MKLHDWSVIPLETLNPAISRKVVHCQRLTVARLFLKAGAVVPRHHHENEQLTMIASGKLKFIYPDREVIIGTGQVLETPPNLPHRVEALEDSEALDLFVPVREDWIRGDDAYLREGKDA